MSTATLGNTSTVFADRPIRPLPKRRLRSRLSVEVADTILYPPEVSASASKPRLRGPHNGGSASGHKNTYQEANQSTRVVVGNARAESPFDVNERYQFKGNDHNSEDESKPGPAHGYREQHQRSPTIGNGSSRNSYTVRRDDYPKYGQATIPQSAVSSGDSIDGYDSFENTNNKKKRKIPTSGSLGHSSTLSTDMASMGISTARDIDLSQGDVDQDGGVGHYYGSGSSAIPAGSSGTGISGAGRGRYGRAVARRHSGRTPLGASFNGSNSQLNALSFYSRRESLGVGTLSAKAASASKSDQGIISAAIANAAALPVTIAKGQENISLLEQESSKKSVSPRTQFTFSCEPASGNSMAWPGYEFSSPNGSQRTAQEGGATSQDGQSHKIATQGTQSGSNAVNSGNHAVSRQVDVAQQASQQPKKPRRPLTKQYAAAARERRLRQDYNNYHHPPREEDVWICEFCEYESIFGSPPEALIRQYEVKDRRERRRVAEKRRLLEKAKTKGKKGKKANKNAKYAGAAAHPPTLKSKSDQQSFDQLASEVGVAQGEDCSLNEINEPLHQTPSRIPQPISQNQNHSLRPPGGHRISGSAVRT